MAEELPALAFPGLAVGQKAFWGVTYNGRLLDEVFYPSCWEERPVILSLFASAEIEVSCHSRTRTESPHRPENRLWRSAFHPCPGGLSSTL